jgi:hypothetical protein
MTRPLRIHRHVDQATGHHDHAPDLATVQRRAQPRRRQTRLPHRCLVRVRDRRDAIPHPTVDPNRQIP